MVHFVTNLQHYIMVEVMQTSWAKLSAKLPESADLDSVISAHDECVLVVVVVAAAAAAVVVMVGCVASLFFCRSGGRRRRRWCCGWWGG